MRKIYKSNVCVIGGAGFLGSHLVRHLIDDRNCQVTVVDNLCVGRKDYIPKTAKFVHHDITGSEEFLASLFKQEMIEYVFNYAAWPYIPDSFVRPLQVFSVNATGAIKVINAAQTAGCKGILQVSSAELYGRNKSGLLTEKSTVEPHSTYGAAKAAVDYYCQSAWRERQTPVIALRQFNCVGERETHPYVVPEIISQLYESDVVRLGNNSSRDFLYAGDAVAMAVQLLEKGEFGEVYNLGSERYIMIYELAELIGELMNKTVTVVPDETRKRPWEIWHLQASNSKIYECISGRPQVSLEEAIRRTIAYYESNNHKWDWHHESLSTIGI